MGYKPIRKFLNDLVIPGIIVGAVSLGGLIVPPYNGHTSAEESLKKGLPQKYSIKSEYPIKEAISTLGNVIKRKQKKMIKQNGKANPCTITAYCPSIRDSVEFKYHKFGKHALLLTKFYHPEGKYGSGRHVSDGLSTFVEIGIFDGRIDSGSIDGVPEEVVLIKTTLPRGIKPPIDEKFEIELFKECYTNPDVKKEIGGLYHKILTDSAAYLTTRKDSPANK